MKTITIVDNLTVNDIIQITHNDGNISIADYYYKRKWVVELIHKDNHGKANTIVLRGQNKKTGAYVLGRAILTDNLLKYATVTILANRAN